MDEHHILKLLYRITILTRKIIHVLKEINDLKIRIFQGNNLPFQGWQEQLVVLEQKYLELQEALGETEKELRDKLKELNIQYTY